VSIVRKSDSLTANPNPSPGRLGDWLDCRLTGAPIARLDYGKF